MKKWHKWLIAVLIFIIAVIVAAVCIYHYYAKDKIENVLEKAQVVLQDERLRKEVETFADEMVESGELDSSQLDGYLAYKEAGEAKSPAENTVPHTVPTPSPKPKTLIERVKEEMTAEEFAFAMSIYGKLDVNYCVSNYYTNKKEVKKYIKSVLTSSEISRSLEIYSKYSYILK